MSNNIRVEITEEEMRQAVRKVFKEEHADVMSQCIVDILFDDGNAMSSFFKGTMNIIPKHNYFVGDRVLCEATALSDWSFDRDLMEDENIIVDGNMEVTIINIKPFNKSRTYTVKYNYIHKTSKKLSEGECYISDLYIFGKGDEVFPGE